MGSVRIVFRKDGIAGKGTFGVVQKVKILKITNVDTAPNTGNYGWAVSEHIKCYRRYIIVLSFSRSWNRIFGNENNPVKKEGESRASDVKEAQSWKYNQFEENKCFHSIRQ